MATITFQIERDRNNVSEKISKGPTLIIRKHKISKFLTTHKIFGWHHFHGNFLRAF